MMSQKGTKGEWSNSDSGQSAQQTNQCLRHSPHSSLSMYELFMRAAMILNKLNRVPAARRYDQYPNPRQQSKTVCKLSVKSYVVFTAAGLHKFWSFSNDIILIFLSALFFARIRPSVDHAPFSLLALTHFLASYNNSPRILAWSSLI